MSQVRIYIIMYEPMGRLKGLSFPDTEYQDQKGNLLLEQKNSIFISSSETSSQSPRSNDDLAIHGQ